MPENAMITAVVEEATASGRIPGAIVTVRADGELVHHSAHGSVDHHSASGLRPDTLLWLASLSKPFGAVALLSLVDEGRVRLEDAVSAYLPEFAEPGRVRVLTPGSPSPFGPPFGPPPDPAPVFDIVPALRELTLLDLLTYTGGLQSIFMWNPEYVMPAQGETLRGYAPKLARLVRDFQPGQGWAYSNGASFDVLSRVVEIASGQELDEFLAERLFEPMGLRQTGFGCASHAAAQPLAAALLDNEVIAGRTFRSTSAGLWSTAHDYLIFAEMLRNGGVHGSRRLLQQETVARMTTNQVGELCTGLNGREPAGGVGFGLGVAVLDDPTAAHEALPAGSFGWDGVGTRRFWVCPAAGWSLFYFAPDIGVQRDIEAAVARAFA
ncbi:serine hydrolase domain-containing protein [Angustibacter luteus]|uniref:Serine hydrolase domain-containing protein n=1 Tax=Angustibacter luteus TaxID=658456 RepID=A0ABW1JDS3_9ACTN